MMAKDFYIGTLSMADAVSLHTLMVTNAERFQRYLPLTTARNKTVEGSERYILNKQKEIKANSEFTFAIKERATHEVAGLVILKEIDWNKKEGELAYGIDLRFGSRGWMTKAVREVSDNVFKKKQLKTLRIIVHHTNTASVKVAENCGFTWQKTLKKEYTPPGESPLDMELYELSR